MSEHYIPNAKRQEEEIDLRDIAATLMRQKSWIIGCTAGAGAIALIASLLMTPIYTATTTILPPQQQSNSIAAALGSLGALAGAGGMAALKNPNDLYVGMLESQTVADRLIEQFALRQRYQQETLVGTRKALVNASNINAGKDGLISVSVDDADPAFAAKLANAYIDELKKLSQNLAVTDGAQRRLFFEKQLEKVKQDLSRADVSLKQRQEKTGLLQPEGQIKAIIDNVATFKAQIATKEVQLSAMRSFATEQNPDYLRTQQEITAMQKQLAQLERGQLSAGDIVVPTGKLPESGLAYIRALREVKYQETLFELMSKQFEMAKLDEARDSALIQVLDVATTPDYRSKPKRMLIVLAGTALGAVAGVVLALLCGRRLQK
ncbi:Wzz/FepE/Etk N-terminal domain-containing protein [Vogesella sp. AC12]|uniref:GumC family protein n=1 Tax=Vogesella sp. AC12 TaxID=2950550 RepID=UPI00210BCA79|nr:Wzz/FepE/Etk N-terminal domain-containing protein [Vogesella sp. AC12]MCQ4143603.1 Wzz/FepE/Etk N-terminal domain-containing protein [Vogesella sp. AC12]